jgi:hypothetical protein
LKMKMCQFAEYLSTLAAPPGDFTKFVAGLQPQFAD